MENNEWLDLRKILKTIRDKGPTALVWAGAFAAFAWGSWLGLGAAVATSAFMQKQTQKLQARAQTLEQELKQTFEGKKPTSMPGRALYWVGKSFQRMAHTVDKYFPASQQPSHGMP